jgi:hypothetical protein
MEKSNCSLYRRVLGERLDLLPEALKSFHDSLSGGQGRGLFRVRRGQGIIQRIVGFFAGFPPAAADVQVLLKVTVDEDVETWTRQFGDHKMVSQQWQQDKLLVEQFFPLRFAMALEADEKGMSFQIRRSYFGPLPLPRFFNPKMTAFTKGSEDGWHILLRIEASLLGLLVEYEGDLTCL